MQNNDIATAISTRTTRSNSLVVPVNVPLSPFRPSRSADDVHDLYLDLAACLNVEPLELPESAYNAIEFVIDGYDETSVYDSESDVPDYGFFDTPYLCPDFFEVDYHEFCVPMISNYLRTKRMVVDYPEPHMMVKSLMESVRTFAGNGDRHFNFKFFVENFLAIDDISKSYVAASRHNVHFLREFLPCLYPHLIFAGYSDRLLFIRFYEGLYKSLQILPEQIPFILVGIELNPGPDNFLEFLRENDRVIMQHSGVYLAFYQKCSNPEQVARLIMKLPEFRSLVSNQLKIPKKDLMLLAYIYTAPDNDCTHFIRSDDGYLVGIETNPGPSVLSTPSTLKRSAEPQMRFPFTFGFDQDTNNLLSDLVETIDEAGRRGFDVNHRLSSDSLKDAIDPYLKMFADLTTKSKMLQTSVTIGLCMVAAYATFKLGKVMSNFVISLITPSLNENEARVVSEFAEMSPQMGSSEAVTALMGYMYYQAIGDTMPTGDLQGFLSRSDKIFRQKEGIVGFIDYVLSLLQNFADYLATNYNVPVMKFRTSGHVVVDELSEELLSLLSTLRSTGLYNAENGKIAYDIEARLRKVKADIPRTRDFVSQQKAVYDLEMSLRPIVQRFERNNIVGNGPRKEPLGIMLGGPSGVGKSTATVPILLAVMSRVLPEDKLKSFVDNHNDFIWNFVPENHFHDAFHGQFCTIIDEAGSTRDVAGTADAGAMGAIRFINTACYPLTMAHLEDKGNTNFNSELVFATTNRNFFKWNSMYSSEAYVRRFKIAMLAVPKAKYCIDTDEHADPWSRRLDLSKIPANSGPFCEDIPEYIPWDFLNGARATGEVLDFNALVEKIVADFESTRDKGDKMLQAHVELKAKYISERIKPQMDFGEIFDKFSLKVPKVTSGAIGMIAMAVAAAGLMWYVCRDKIVDQSGNVKSKKTNAAKPKKVFRSRVVKAKALKPQFGANANVVFSAKKIYKRNMYKVFPKDSPNASVFCTFIKGRLAIIPAHFAHGVQTMIDAGSLQSNPDIVFTKCGAPSVGFDISFDDLEFTYISEDDSDEEKRDIYFLKVPKVVPSHADISACFPDWFKFSNKMDVCLMKKHGDDVMFMCAQSHSNGAVNYGAFTEVKSFKYDLPTQVGDCGSLVFYSGPDASRAVIIGMHIAGNGATFGVSTQLNHELITCGLNLESDPCPTFDPDTPDAEVQMGDRFIVGQAVQAPSMPSSNMVIPSKLYGTFNDPTCAPSMLRPLDLGEGLKDPWESARSKYSRHQSKVNLDLLAVVAADVSQTILYAGSENYWDPKVYDIQMAIRGTPGVPFCDAIPRNTSPGYPFNLDNKLGGKKQWFGTGQDYDFSSPEYQELEKSIKSSIVALSHGKRMNVVYADYLKDERRKKEKVVQGKTRLISASPLDYLVICRMYFGDFVRSVMSGRINNEIAVGVNPFSHEWTWLANHMKSVGNNCIFGDYSSYDGSLPISFMYKVLEIIEDFYAAGSGTYEDSVIRASLFEDVVNSRHLSVKEGKGVIYEWFGSNPSGNFLTTTLNSVVNLLLIRYAIADTLVSQGVYSSYIFAIAEYKNNVRAIVFGDDNGMCLSDHWAKYINQATFTESMKKVGMVYTDETKSSENTLVHRPLEECTFLKRGFKYDSAAKRWDAPLERETIEEMCNWTKKNCNDQDLINTIETAVKESAFHGKPYYTDFTSRISSASLKALKYKPTCVYNESLKVVRSTDQYY